MEGRWFGGGAVIGDEEVVGCWCWFGWCIHVTFLPAKSKSALSIADNIFPPNRGAPLRYGFTLRRLTEQRQTDEWKIFIQFVCPSLNPTAQYTRDQPRICDRQTKE
jgi:hypothetical protein